MYNGNTTGVLGKWPYPPFYWWESGAAWGGMMNYWWYTGDYSWYDVTHEGLVSQISPTFNYLPIVEMFDEGNDDIGFWVFGAMTAAEMSLRSPPPPYPSWLQISVNVFKDFAVRWNDASSTCGGGLRWQVFESSPGYHYKNTISNGCFFALAARLYRMLGDAIYLQWANAMWDWTVNVGLMNKTTYAVFDGADEMINCTGKDHHQWSYNVAVYLQGAAVLSNFTGDPKWKQRAIGLTAASSLFHTPYANVSKVIYEQECETKARCNIDQYSFKAYLVRWLSEAAVLVPETRTTVQPVLEASAIGAARACTGGGTVDFSLNICGARWYWSSFDNTAGLGQPLSAMEVFYSLLVLIHLERVPMLNVAVTNGTGVQE